MGSVCCRRHSGGEPVTVALLISFPVLFHVIQTRLQEIQKPLPKYVYFFFFRVFVISFATHTVIQSYPRVCLNMHGLRHTLERLIEFREARERKVMTEI